jgi:cytochrome P450
MMAHDDLLAAETPVDRLARDFQGVTDTYDGTGAPDPFPLVAELRRTTPVMEGDILARFNVPSQADYGGSGRRVFTVFRYNDVLQVLRDPANWLSYILADGFGSATENLLMTAMDGEEHKKFRKLISPPFAMELIRSWNDLLVRPIIVDEYIATLKPLGRADLVRDYGLQFPVEVAYALFGFPKDKAATMQFASWALQILSGPQKDPAKAAVMQAAAYQAAVQMYQAMLPIIQARRAENRRSDDLLGFLLHVEQDRVTFSDHDIANLLRMLLLAATETTTRTFAILMLHLFEHPEVMARLKADRSLIPKALNESMRLEPVNGHMARVAGKDMLIGGVTIPKGDAVTLSIFGAHRDETVFVDPDKFDLDRPTKLLMGFGFGPHMCLGQHIARVEVEVAVDALLDLPNLRLDPAFPAPQLRAMQLRAPDHLHVVWDV